MRKGSFAPAVLAVLLAAASSGALFAGKGKAEEEGTWKVTVTPVPAAAAKGEKEFEDTLVLRKGKFHSTACEPYGFGEAPYRVEGNNWMSDGASKKEGRSHWHGVVDGDAVSGQMTWTKPDGSVLNYTFAGTRSGDPSPAGGSRKPKN